MSQLCSVMFNPSIIKAMKNHFTLLALGAVLILFSACKKEKGEPEAKPDSVVEVSDINITYPEDGVLSLKVGDTDKIKYELEPEDATGEVEWESSDEEVASVKNGKVTALAPGKTTITLSCDDVEAEVEVIVTSAEVEAQSFTLQEKMSAYCDLWVKIPIEVEPAEAISSLKCEYDESAVSVVLKDGAYQVLALKEANSTITFSSENLDAQSIYLVTYATRMDLGFLDRGKYYESYENGQEVDFFSLSTISGGFYDGKRYILMSLYPAIAPSPSKADAKSENGNIVKAKIGDVSDPWLRVILEYGEEEGTTDIVVGYYDDMKEKPFQKTLRIRKMLPVFSDNATLTSRGTMLSDVTLQKSKILFLSVMDLTTNETFRSKWSIKDNSIAKLVDSPEEDGYYSQEVILKAYTAGTTTVTATDSKGKELSFKLTVL